LGLVSVPLWEQERLRIAAGSTLRPGGFSLTDRAAEVIGLLPGWRVLDVGCGLGATVERLRSRFGAQAWGIEVSDTQIARIQGVSGIIQACGDVLPFVSDSFDALYCECVFSLFPDQKKGLDEFWRVLKPNGFLVLSDLYSLDDSKIESFSCAGRAVPVLQTHEAVEKKGFFVRLLEDHSPYLKELAAKIIWAGNDENEACARRLGYYLMISQKQGAFHAG
jgi:ubiquinone/menaquinone biosynthesis C-methylase UbiE